MINLPRRKFLVGAASLLAAPAVIRVARLMPVRVYKTVPFKWDAFTDVFCAMDLGRGDQSVLTWYYIDGVFSRLVAREEIVA
jgi:hypothetical protein